MYGAIFDMDGTLLDSMHIWVKITTDFLAKRNIPLSLSFAEAVQEMTLEESCVYIKQKFKLPETPEELLTEFNHMAAYEYTHNIPLKPYAKQYLETLHKNGIKLAIATSGFGNLCKAALMRCGVWNLFDAIALSSEVGVNKSNPDVYLLAARRLGVLPEHCTVYEDILPAVKGAKKAGMKVVAVYDESAENVKESLKALADRYITGWHELL